jgi:hypothetical protein
MAGDRCVYCGRRNLQGLQMSKPRQKASKTKLKAMNQISAAEAWKLFHAAWVLDATGQYRLRPEYLPPDIDAESFFKGLVLCRLLLRGQRAEGADTSTLTEKGLDKHFSGAPQQRKIVDFIWRNKNRKMSLKEIAVELGGVTPKTVQNLLTKIFKKKRTPRTSPNYAKSSLLSRPSSQGLSRTSDRSPIGY